MQSVSKTQDVDHSKPNTLPNGKQQDSNILFHEIVNDPEYLDIVHSILFFPYCTGVDILWSGNSQKQVGYCTRIHRD